MSLSVKQGMSFLADGEIIEGLASIDESAITGESAPVIREAGGDKSSVTGGTKSALRFGFGWWLPHSPERVSSTR